MNITVIERAHLDRQDPDHQAPVARVRRRRRFILDADTFLEPPNYIERCVQELFQGVGIAAPAARSCRCG